MSLLSARKTALFTGPQGPAGRDGAAGLLGPAGATGPIGPQGPAGTGVHLTSAAGDGKTVTDGAMSSSGAVYTLACSTSNPFLPGLAPAGSVNKLVVVHGAGTAGADLCTTIATYVDSGHVTLTAACGTTVSGATVDFGTDCTAALTADLANAYNSVALVRSAVVEMPPGQYMVTGLLNMDFTHGTGVWLRGQASPTYENAGMRTVIMAATPCAYLIKGTGVQSRISNIWFHGNHLATDVILAEYLTSESLVEHCWITAATVGAFGTGGNLVHVPNGSPFAEEVNNLTFEYCSFYGDHADPTKKCGSCVYLFENSEATQNTFYKCVFAEADYLFVNLGCDADINSCQLYSAGTLGFYIFAGYNNTIERCYTEQLGGDFLLQGNNAAASTSGALNLINNTINDSAATVSLNCTQAVILQGNIISSTVAINPYMVGGTRLGVYPVTAINNGFPNQQSNGGVAFAGTGLDLLTQIDNGGPIYSYTVTGATNASPIVVQLATPTNMNASQTVTITGVVGNTAANVTGAAFTVVDPTHISLTGTTGNGAYSSGGVATPSWVVDVVRTTQFNGAYFGVNGNVSLGTQPGNASVGMLEFHSQSLITIGSPTTDTYCLPLVLTGATPYSGASTTNNKSSGYVQADSPVPVSGGYEGGVVISRAGTGELRLCAYPGGGAGCIYLGSANEQSPGTTNYTIYGDDTGHTIINAYADSLSFRTNGGVDRMDVNSSGVTVYQNTWAWTQGCTNPTVEQITSTNTAVNGAPMTFVAQTAASAATNKNGGDIQLMPGSGAGGGVAGLVSFQNPTTQSTVGAAGGASALPATPAGYLDVRIGSTVFEIPYYTKV